MSHTTSKNLRKDFRSNERFHQLFPSVPVNEIVVQSELMTFLLGKFLISLKSICIDQKKKGFSCAYIKSLNLLHGIMFLTSNFICFYSKILAHETILVFKWQHITTIVKTNYALLFPTAIRIETTKSNVSQFHWGTFWLIFKIWVCKWYRFWFSYELLTRLYAKVIFQRKVMNSRKLCVT